MNIDEIKNKLFDQQDLSSNEASFVFDIIMNGEMQEIDMASILIALKIKKETTDEIFGAVKIMREKSKFRVLLVYPNLPLMLVPSIAIGLFTRILKHQGYVVDLFETTHYLAEENSSSENRAEYLNVREFSITDDLSIEIKTDLEKIKEQVQNIL